MKMTLTKINDSEWKLSKGHSPFFILKQKCRLTGLETGNDYHTAQLFEYDPIKEQIKEWLLEEGIPQFYSRKLGSIRTEMEFNYSIITSLFRDNKLNELGI